MDEKKITKSPSFHFFFEWFFEKLERFLIWYKYNGDQRVTDISSSTVSMYVRIYLYIYKIPLKLIRFH